MAKENRKLLFVKNTGVLIGEITDEMDLSVMNLDSFRVKDVEIDVSAGEYWFGDYATGRVMSSNDKPLVTESELRYNTNLKILTAFPIHTQLSIVIDMLDKIATEKTPEFVELKAFLDKERALHKEKVQTYANNPEAYVWLSQEAENAQNAKKTV